MAVPTSIETDRTLYLQSILNSVPAENLAGWPMPTRGDYTLIGRILVHYSYIDFYLLRMVEVFDKQNFLPEKFRGKTERMKIGDVEDSIETARDWAENSPAFERIRELRKIRNLMAHYAVKRFPTEDAFLFLAKGPRDFKRVLNMPPSPGMALTGVADIGQTTKNFKVIEGLLKWLAQATTFVEDEYFDSLKRS
jgi:hypothetical protein